MVSGALALGTENQLVVDFAYHAEWSGENRTARPNRAQAEWIDCNQRAVTYIDIYVLPTPGEKPNRNRLDVPPHLRHVVPVPVLMQPRLGVVVLPGEAEVEEGGAGD